MLPPLPDWDGLHPLVVHFPIALLLTAPVFILIAILIRKAHRPFNVAALILMAIGTVAAYISVQTGEAAADLAIRTRSVSAVLERHEELAERSALFFAILTLVFAVLVVGPLFIKKPLKGTVIVPIHVAFLLVYLGATLVLANTAHQGGRLVHEFGVHAFVVPSEESEE